MCWIFHSMSKLSNVNERKQNTSRWRSGFWCHFHHDSRNIFCCRYFVDWASLRESIEWRWAVNICSKHETGNGIEWLHSWESSLTCDVNVLSVSQQQKMGLTTMSKKISLSIRTRRRILHFYIFLFLYHVLFVSLVASSFSRRKYTLRNTKTVKRLT